MRYGQSIFDNLDEALEYAVVDENREIWAYCTAPKLCGFNWVKQGILVVFIGKDSSVKHWQSSLIKRHAVAA